MNDNLTLMTLTQLATECAQRWQFAGKACPECHGALYAHQALAPLQLGYQRCPQCQVNLVQINGIAHMDALADSMLDELARRTQFISYPGATIARQHPQTGILDAIDQPPDWRG